MMSDELTTDELFALFEDISTRQAVRGVWEGQKTLDALAELDLLTARIGELTKIEVRGLYPGCEELGAAYVVGEPRERDLVFALADFLAHDMTSVSDLLRCHNWLHMLDKFGGDLVPLMSALLRDAIDGASVEYRRLELVRTVEQEDGKPDSEELVVGALDDDALASDESGVAQCDAGDEHAALVTHLWLDCDKLDALKAVIAARETGAKLALRGGNGDVPPAPGEA